MGVQGLWQLLDPLGRPVALESLENKILAVDASIWLHQAVHGCRDRNGNPLPNAHLLGLFNRVCKLLFYGIKPVFVFDGAVPLLKKQTMAARRSRQQNAAKEVEKTRQQILNKVLQRKAIQDVLYANSKQAKTSVGKSSEAVSLPSSQPSVDLFELPPLPSTSETKLHPFLEESESDSSDLDDPRAAVFQNLDAINIDSEDFQALPLEIQHEILLEMQERHKRRSWTNHEVLPENSEEIGNFQIQQLLKRRKIRQRIDTVKKSLTASITRHLVAGHDDEFDSFSSGAMVEAKRIASEDSAHYILFKKLQDNLFPAKIKSSTETSPLKHKVTGTENQQISVLPKPSVTIDDDDDDSVVEVKTDDHPLGKSPQPSGETSTFAEERFDIKQKDECQVVADLREAVIRLKKVETMNSSEPDVVVLENQNVVVSQCEPEAAISVSTQVTNEVEGRMKTVSSSNTDVTTVAVQSPNQLEDRGYVKVDQSNPSTEPCTQSGILPLSNSSGVGKVTIVSESQLVNSVQEVLQKDDQKEDVQSIRSKQGDVNLASIQKVLQEDVQTKEVTMEALVKVTEVHEISSNSEDDGNDFFEVEVIPEQVAEDELFPLEIFNISKERDSPEMVPSLDSDVGEVSSTPASFLGSATQSSEELQRLSEVLEDQTVELLQDKARQERTAATITDQMYMESQELLRLFGIPFVVSPAEAEAQCATLDALELTDGTITDDSDIWLFGARCVYKNFFERRREVLRFCNLDVEQRLHLDRSKLIALALLTGSDYTEGVKSVGVVTALEILGEFSADDGIQSLKMFRSWWDSAQQQLVAPSETKVKQKLRGLLLRDGFPSPAVVQAYLEPLVESSKEKFSWAFPDLDALRTFASRKLGWSLDKTNEVLLPIIKRLNAARERQMRITSYFTPVARDSQEVKHPSRRLKRALHKVQFGKDEPNAKAPTGDSKVGKVLATSDVKSKRGRGRKVQEQSQNVRRRSAREKKTLCADLKLSETSSSDSDVVVKEERLPSKRTRRINKKS